jgi:hypothetical protein
MSVVRTTVAVSAYIIHRLFSCPVGDAFLLSLAAPLSKARSKVGTGHGTPDSEDVNRSHWYILCKFSKIPG